ncbi:MAG: hypothetical protein LBF36_01570 [Mycoplasmataceae bacterium]|jgi:hypothetical protein|nr:hypothetical protein [Mycoplasmataceae bacterium]
MKLFGKLCLISIGLSAVTSMVIFTTAACAKSNPYQAKKTGDSITISSKKDASNCIAVAKDYILTQSPKNISSENWNDELAFKLITNEYSESSDAMSFASTQIYWQLVYYMCDQYSNGVIKGSQTIKVEGIPTSSFDGRCIFTGVNENDVTILKGVSISFMEKNYNNEEVIKYVIPTSVTGHFTLNIGSDAYTSYSLWAWNLL